MRIFFNHCIDYNTHNTYGNYFQTYPRGADSQIYSWNKIILKSFINTRLLRQNFYRYFFDCSCTRIWKTWISAIMRFSISFWDTFYKIENQTLPSVRHFVLRLMQIFRRNGASKFQLLIAKIPVKKIIIIEKSRTTSYIFEEIRISFYKIILCRRESLITKFNIITLKRVGKSVP